MKDQSGEEENVERWWTETMERSYLRSEERLVLCVWQSPHFSELKLGPFGQFPNDRGESRDRR